MRQKMQRRYFAVLFFPFLTILCLAIWLTFFSHGKGMQAMRNDVEGSRLSVAQSVAANIDTLIEQVRLNAANWPYKSIRWIPAQRISWPCIAAPSAK